MGYNHQAVAILAIGMGYDHQPPTVTVDFTQSFLAGRLLRRATSPGRKSAGGRGGSADLDNQLGF